MTTKFYKISEILCSLSYGLDFINPTLSNHHIRVCYTATELARHMNISKDCLDGIFISSLIHDIGFLSTEARVDAMEFETFMARDCSRHCELGHALIKDIPFLSEIAAVVLNHHKNFEKHEDNEKFLAPYIIHLADRVDALLVTTHLSSNKGSADVLNHSPSILNRLSTKKQYFHPDVIEAFTDLAGRESFWLDLVSPEIFYILESQQDLGNNLVDLQDFVKIARVFSKVIDYRSSFTVVHSSGVAAIASSIAEIIGFSREEVLIMEIAGLLHDIGKIAVPAEILEKPGSLTLEEAAIIRTHTYYTYKILSKIRDITPINIWAAYHHERLDGKGYPFKKKGSEIPLGARIMAVADVLSALTEDRPYRRGMTTKNAKKIMVEMVKSGALDGDIYDLALDHFEYLDHRRKEVQQTVSLEYVQLRTCSNYQLNIAV